VLREHGIEPGTVEAGEGGRVDRARAEALVAGRGSAAADGRREERVRMSPLRRTIAERLVRAQQEAALLTTFNEVDMTRVMEIRASRGERFRERHGVKLGFMSFFARAVVEALRACPGLNARVDGDEIVYRDYVDLGVAVGSGKGLVVPVLRDAHQLGFAEVERAVRDFAQRAQENALAPEDLQGGTFTISNGGVYGSLLSTPIVNPPQSGILGLHAIQQRPVEHEGAIALRPMMYVALTYDHRVVDGREAVGFLRQVKQCVEDPVEILLEL
jgi:2-oxoglutarate dehydrogenase E2 component (dihydrolipoamide succinyltransferase)